MSRFLALSIGLLILVMALFQFGLAALGWLPSGAPAPPPPRVQMGAWGLEALGLAALFLLTHREEGKAWLSGLLSGWIAWVFRGPLLVVAVAAAGLDPKPYWAMTFRWWVLYSVCGLVLAALSRPPRNAPPLAQPVAPPALASTLQEPAEAPPEASAAPPLPPETEGPAA